MSQVFTAELCAKANVVRLFEQLGLKVDVAERAPGLVSCGREIVIVFYGGEFDGQKVLLRAGAAYYERDVVWRAGGCAEALHLLHEEWQQRAFILNRGFRHGVEVRLVCRAATFGHHDEAIFVTLNSLNVNLRRQVAAGVDLIIHVEGGVL